MMGQRSAAPVVARTIPAVATNIKLVHKIYKGAKLFHEYIEQFDYSWIVSSRSSFFKDDKRISCQFLKMEYSSKNKELVATWSVVKEEQL